MLKKNNKAKKIIATSLVIGSIANLSYPLIAVPQNKIESTFLKAPLIRPDAIMEGREEVTVTISYGEQAEVKEYRINDGAWETYIEPLIIKQNGTIFARSSKQESVSPVASLKVNNIGEGEVPGETMSVIYVSPEGTDVGSGTLDNPMSITKAISEVAPGGTIYVTEGVYVFDKQLTIPYGNNGREDAIKSIVALDGSKVRFDFSSQPYDKNDMSKNQRGIQLDGSYWHIKGLEIYGAADNGMYVTGNDNIVEMCVLNANRDTGLQISRRHSMLSDMADWPRNNLILNCTAFDNSDPATGENADGFAAKLTCGEGNVFDGCIAYNNVDDGWDLFAKVETGPIGAVTIRNSIAFRNGCTTSGQFTKNSDGNGFKMGGSNIAGNHILENCVAFENKNHGFTDNSNPGPILVKNCTSFNNSRADGKKANIDFARHITSRNTLENIISYTSSGKTARDKYRGEGAYSVFFNGTKYYEVRDKQPVDTEVVDKMGQEVPGPKSTDFVSIQAPSLGENVHETWRNPDGSINMGDFLKLSENSQYKGQGTNGADRGASLHSN